MAPKTKSRTAIWYYAKECIANGKIKSYNVKDAIEEVYPEWKEMVAHQKAPYEILCDKWRAEVKLANNIFTRPVDAKIKQEYMDVDEEEQGKLGKELENLLKNLSTIKNETAGDHLSSIKQHRWYFINFQTFCKSDSNSDSDYNYKPYYVLAEIGLIEYSLQDGIIDEYHAFIKPNQIPLGYTSQCMDRSKEEHQIPLYNFEKAKKTYAEIYANIRKFLLPKKENNFFVPVFCMSKEIEETRFGLKYLFNNTPGADARGEFPFKRIFDLESLVVNLGKRANIEYSTASAHDILTSYKFDYTPKSRCPFHEELGIINCSLGLVKKAAYHISDNICQFYDIELTTKHIPATKSIGTVIYKQQSNFCSDFSYKNSTSSLNSQVYSANTYSSSSSVNREACDDNHSSVNSSISVTTRNMPSVDIRRTNRQLVSDKFAANFSTVSSSIKTGARYEQTSTKGDSYLTAGSIISDSIDSNVSSVLIQNRYTATKETELLEDDDEDEWTTIEKGGHRGKTRKTHDDTMSVFSNKTNSTLTENDEFSLKNSSTRSYMGRGRALSYQR